MKPSDFRFKLQPWETRSDFDGVPHAWTRAHWRGQERTFALALVGGFIRFCNLDDPRVWNEAGEWNFVAGSPMPAEQSQLERGDASAVRDSLERKFRVALVRGDVERLLSLDKAKDWLFLGYDGRGKWLSHSNPTPFDFRVPDEFWAYSSSFWHEAFTREDPQIVGDFAFAREWHHCGADHIWLISTLQRGTREEFERVGWWLIRAHTSRLKQARQGGFDTVIVNFEGEPPHHIEWRFLSGSTDQSPLLAQEEPLWRFFIEWFGPRHNTEMARAHPCSAAWQSPQDASWHVFAEADEPSAHELLETRLQIRNWLRERAGLPDERIAQLLN